MATRSTWSAVPSSGGLGDEISGPSERRRSASFPNEPRGVSSGETDEREIGLLMSGVTEEAAA